MKAEIVDIQNCAGDSEDWLLLLVSQEIEMGSGSVLDLERTEEVPVFPDGLGKQQSQSMGRRKEWQQWELEDPESCKAEEVNSIKSAVVSRESAFEQILFL